MEKILFISIILSIVFVVSAVGVVIASNNNLGIWDGHMGMMDGDHHHHMGDEDDMHEDCDEYMQEECDKMPHEDCEEEYEDCDKLMEDNCGVF